MLGPLQVWLAMRINTIYHKVMYSDARNTAGAGYIVGVDKAVAHGMWSLVETTKSRP